MTAKLCEKCQERDATVYTTTIIHGVMTTGSLCTECSEAAPAAHDRYVAGLLRDLAAEAKTRSCKYCNSQPCVPTMDLLASFSGEQHHIFLCVPCSKEFARFFQQEFPVTMQITSPQERLAAWRTLHERADEHMKRWVSQRDER